MKKIIATGASGWIGRNFLAALEPAAFEVHAIVRKQGQLAELVPPDSVIVEHAVPDLANCEGTELGTIFEGADTVVHLAAAIQEKSGVADSATVAMARTIAQACKTAGVARIVLVSSIAARVAQEDASRARQYGMNKLAAEREFITRLTPASQQIVILRPPAVYGRGMSGPIAALVRLVEKGLPLPLGAAHAPRDYLSIGNMSALLQLLVAQSWPTLPDGRQTYEPSDGQAIGTAALVREIGRRIGKKPLLLPVPVSVLKAIAGLVGKRQMVEGAVDGLRTSGNADLGRDFGWEPVEQMPQSLSGLV